MPEKKEPLLLLDNSTMYVVGAGDYHSTNLSSVSYTHLFPQAFFRRLQLFPGVSGRRAKERGKQLFSCFQKCGNSAKGCFPRRTSAP